MLVVGEAAVEHWSITGLKALGATFGRGAAAHAAHQPFGPSSPASAIHRHHTHVPHPVGHPCHRVQDRRRGRPEEIARGSGRAQTIPCAGSW